MLLCAILPSLMFIFATALFLKNMLKRGYGFWRTTFQLGLLSALIFALLFKFGISMRNNPTTTDTPLDAFVGMIAGYAFYLLLVVIPLTYFVSVIIIAGVGYLRRKSRSQKMSG